MEDDDDMYVWKYMDIDANAGRYILNIQVILYVFM